MRIKELGPRLKELGMTACAITDHGSLAGLVSFQKELQKQGVKPLLGCEVYISDDVDGIEDNSLKTKDNHHLVLIAKDQIGYELLLELSSNAALNNFYYKPRISKHHLVKCTDHVVASTACLAGEMCKQAYLNNSMTVLDYLEGIFGEDLYLELQDWDDGTGVQQAYNKWLLGLKKDRPHLKYILTCDVHYLKKEDHELHEMVIAMQLKKTLQEYRDDGRMIYGPWFYVRSSEEMWRSAQELDCEEAYLNTAEVASKCTVTIPLGTYHLPTFDVTKAKDYEDFLRWKENRNGTQKI